MTENISIYKKGGNKSRKGGKHKRKQRKSAKRKSSRKERPCKNHMDNNPKTYLDTIYFRNNIKWQKKV